MTSESTDQVNLLNGSESAKQMDENKSDAKNETSNETFGKLDFVNTQPMREEQVQNAVKFLSHPKVRGSPVIYRRSFLEKKGLTKEEIDEAFRRVPDLPPNTTTTYSPSPNQDGEMQSSSTSQPPLPSQSLKSSPASPADSSTFSTSHVSHFHWSHVLFAVGLFAASGAGAGIIFKTVVIPKLKAWIRNVVSEDDSMQLPQPRPNAIEEAVAAAKAAAAAAADAAKASQEILTARNDERKYLELVTKLLDSQIGEMKSMQNSLNKMQGTMGVSLLANRQTDEKMQAELSGVIPNRTSAPVESMVAQHPKSYMDIMAMVQRGEKPPNIKDINDKPPNPNQPPSNPRQLPRAKPWEVNQTRSTYEARPVSGFDPYANEPSQMNERFVSSTIDYSKPWQLKGIKMTEIEPEKEWSRVSDDMLLSDRPTHRGWVPPPPPPISMAEAAAAIRKPKPLIPKEQINRQRVSPHSSTNGEADTSGAGSSASSAELKEVVGVAELMKADVETVQPDLGGSSNGAVVEGMNDMNGENVEIKE